MLLMPAMSAGGPVTAEAVPAGTPPGPVIAAGIVSETTGESATVVVGVSVVVGAAKDPGDRVGSVATPPHAVRTLTAHTTLRKSLIRPV